MNSLSGKTVLVTGATGFIGSHLVKRLRQKRDIQLVLLSRRQIVERSTDVTWICSSLDNLSPETWQKAGVNKIDIIFHLAAFTPKSRAEADHVAEIYRDNLIGTRTLLDSLPSRPERIVFASTIDVYAMHAVERVIDETSPAGAFGLYGASKLFCEQLVQFYAELYDCGHAILRYGHIFGPGEESYEKLIPSMIRRLLRGEPPILYGDGSAERDYLYVDDAVEATVRAAVSGKKKMGPVNIVRGASTPIREIAELLIGITEFKGQIIYLKDKPNGHSLRFNNRLMRELLEAWCFVGLEEGLKHEVDYVGGFVNERR